MPKTLRVATNRQPAAKTPSSSLPEKMIALPTKRIVPSKHFHDYACCVFGEKSVGKTSLCAQFPDAVVFQWEAGRRHLPIFQVPQQGEPSLTWPRFLKYRDLVIESDFQTAVIDTIDRCYEACQSHYCKERGFKHPNDAGDYGKTWQEIRFHFADVMNDFAQAGKRLVFTSHARLKEVTTKTGRVYEMIVPTCPNQAWEYLKEVADLIVYYGYRDSERAFTVRGSDALAAACGPTGVFLDPDGEPLQSFAAGNSAEQAYQNLLAGFGNKLYGYPVDDKGAEAEDDASDKNEVSKLSLKAKKGK